MTTLADDIADEVREALAAAFVKYSDDQPRDDHGRWEGGGGGGESGGGSDQNESSPIALAAARKYEDRIRNEKTERCMAFSQETGKFVVGAVGTEGGVHLSDEQIGKLDGTTFTHNHPDQGGETATSLSLTDVQTASDGHVREMRAVSSTERVSMTAPNGWPSSVKISEAFNRESAKVRLALLVPVTSGRMTPEQANAEHYDRTWAAVSSQLGMVYSKEHN